MIKIGLKRKFAIISFTRRRYSCLHYFIHHRKLFCYFYLHFLVICITIIHCCYLLSFIKIVYVAICSLEVHTKNCKDLLARHETERVPKNTNRNRIVRREDIQTMVTKKEAAHIK